MTDSGITLGFLGCGNMGEAVLYGLLEGLFPEGSGSPQSSRISKFIACTKTKLSAEKLQTRFSRHSSRLVVLHDETIATIEKADVVVLGFKPYMASGVFETPGVRKALEGKLVISMLAGVTLDELHALIVGSNQSETARPTYIAKAIPNVAARYHQSMTILEAPKVPLPKPEASLVDWIFEQVGHIKYVPLELVDAASMVMTSCMAGLSVPFEGILDGSVVEGVRRPDAVEIAVQAVKGLVAMLENGTHPAVLRESIASPRGCTIQSLLTLEKAGTRAVFAQSLIDGSRHFQSAKDK
ncbi:pyrroline-5-carboxylate reductase [Xylariales sp. PMI_506]|nr:pyrroline-5-carboxylate reductase [Xylariales sp. PMI_506]